MGWPTGEPIGAVYQQADNVDIKRQKCYGPRVGSVGLPCIYSPTVHTHPHTGPTQACFLCDYGVLSTIKALVSPLFLYFKFL